MWSYTLGKISLRREPVVSVALLVKKIWSWKQERIIKVSKTMFLAEKYVQTIWL